MSQNHYQVLGVGTTASAPDIKAAYKRLAIQYHPDKHGGSTRFEEQFKAVNAAYRVLSDAGRRAAYDHQLRRAAHVQELQRQQQAYRQQGQRVYGVPMPPPPAPMRTRTPAGSAERHYRTIPKRRKFTRRDFLLTAGFIGLFVLFVFSVKATMDHVTAVGNYDDGLRAYADGEWSTAHSFFSEALHFKPDYTEALRRRAEITELIYHQPAVAQNDYRAALPHTTRPADRAFILHRLGRYEARTQQPALADQLLTQAVALDSTRAGAWILRGEIRLLTKRQFSLAVRDLSTGLRQRTVAGRAPTLYALTLRGLAHYRLGDYARAQQDYQLVANANPTNGQVHYLLGRVAQRQGQLAEACAAFTQAVRLGYSFASAAQRQSCR
ncbi:heat shock protein DnaJ domain protein [Hymenobacter roseosalivarius DSM 11622]|uniref:Heat shock protein DnaJ domain protein n=1 Tax=Hymenobacter roseosalivarius DSM 11622 TaxID=645990 RepID=A0A1W1UN84_9BACT|nr:J domain-containing protein [Hymenobacter roseosalivarius]SMB82174.1 heat shock protein DnaJ domain protein [Hymenobacter roseosalivarius DSM 11622]